MRNEENILVVDDEPDIREGIILLNDIESRNFQSASNGVEALELLKKQHFDIVVSDISMPKMPGTELIKKARELGIETPFIFISGLSDSNVGEKIRGLSNWHLIEKTDIKKISFLISELLVKKAA